MQHRKTSVSLALATAMLVANAAQAEDTRMQVNVTTVVNASQIKKETLNGVEYWVVPSYTLPSNVVMNRVLYPAAEIDAHYAELEGKLAPLGHPTVNGAFVSASSPEGLERGYFGAYNRNVSKVGNRIYLEKWVNIEVAQRYPDGKRLLAILESAARGEKVRIHTSVALYINPIKADDSITDYDYVAQIVAMDHDAILLDEPGAATPAQGVGMFVNADNSTKMHINQGALKSPGFMQQIAAMEGAVRAQFVQSREDYAYVGEMNESQVVIVRNGESLIYDYFIEDGAVKFSADGVPVSQKTIWQSVKDAVKSILKPEPQAQPVNNQSKGAEMPLTAEDRAELDKTLAANTKTMTDAVQEMLKPLAQQVADLQKHVTANADAEEAKMRREVAADPKYGEVVANSLKGEALKAVHATLTPAAPASAGGITANQQGQQMQAPSMTDHFGPATK